MIRVVRRPDSRKEWLSVAGSISLFSAAAIPGCVRVVTLRMRALSGTGLCGDRQRLVSPRSPGPVPSLCTCKHTDNKQIETGGGRDGYLLWRPASPSIGKFPNVSAHTYPPKDISGGREGWPRTRVSKGPLRTDPEGRPPGSGGTRCPRGRVPYCHRVTSPGRSRA